MNEGTNLHAIFEASFNGSAASALFPTGTYRVVATHVVSGASAETTLNYTNPNEPVSPASPPPTTTTTATNATRGSLNSAASVPEPVTQSSSQTIAEPHTSVAQVPISNSAWPAENNNIPTTTQSIESNVAGGTIGSIALIQNKIFTLYGNWGIQSASKNSVTQSESNSNNFVSNITLADSGNGNSQTFTLANVGPLNMVSAASIGTMNNSTSDSSTSIASTDSNPLLLSIKGNATIKQLGTTIASAGNNNTTINNNATLSAVVETGTLYDVFKIELSGNNELPATIYGIAKKIGTSALSQSLPDLD
jgi:hypothetical protein